LSHIGYRQNGNAVNVRKGVPPVLAAHQKGNPTRITPLELAGYSLSVLENQYVGNSRTGRAECEQNAQDHSR
jgi:hypothetical protein